ncbi:MAG: hypothetical protein ABI995_14465, partial [Acidobacteriota bacterium]
MTQVAFHEIVDNVMNPRTPLFACLSLLLASCSQPAAAPAPGAPVLYEGARLITGDGSAPIENSAFLVENGEFRAVGPKGSIQAPASATHVDLTGKTVIPALVDAHAHLGWAVLRTN